MKNNGKKQTSVIGNPEYQRYDLTNLDNYEQDYEMPWADRIEKVLDIPDTTDMAKVFVRGNFKNDRSLNAHLRLMYRHRKFGDTNHQELLRAKIAGSAALGGERSIMGLFAGIGLFASDVFRVIRGLPKLKKGEDEKIVRGSDFRQESRPENSLGSN